SGSRAVVGAKARVAQPSRILVEGVHDAELVEKVWGDDLRLEGVVVERLDGVDHLADVVAEFSPGPGRRLGVLVDHLVAGRKEAVCAALGGAEPALLWRKLLGAVSTWKDLETPFVRAVEELIDFVTDPGAPPPALADRRRAAAAEWSD